jgi:antitoxin (DNA-binding transcriptional repressor) of toxin-antitoxin stability system
MAAQITVEELETDLAAVLDRVEHNGERITIVRDGRCVAELVPSRRPSGITAKELIDRVGNLALPGEGFADDLEVIQANQGVADAPEWPD